MTQVALKQLRQDSAVDGDAVVYDATSGEWGPAAVVEQDEHKALRHLIHFIDEGPTCGFASGAYKEVLPSGSAFPTSVIWWESASKLQKIVEKTITRTGTGSNVAPTPIVWKMYAEDGVTVVCTVTDVITYSGVFEVSRTRTIA